MGREPRPASQGGTQRGTFRVVSQEAIDWRLPVFEAGRYLVAFDGAALVLLELWRRHAEGAGEQGRNWDTGTWRHGDTERGAGQQAVGKGQGAAGTEQS